MQCVCVAHVVRVGLLYVAWTICVWVCMICVLLFELRMCVYDCCMCVCMWVCTIGIIIVLICGLFCVCMSCLCLLYDVYLKLYDVCLTCV